VKNSVSTLGLAAVLGVAGAAAACSGDDAGSDTDGGACFIAFDPTFDGFRQWTSFSYNAPSDGDGGVHVSGPRIEYTKTLPPHGVAQFPVGSLIVKEVGIDDPANHHIFAMVKRGCDFNAQGAAGWEYFELTEVTGGATIKWRGVVAPAGDNYGADGSNCNGCHAACTDNDSICSQYIRLSDD